MGGSNIQVKRAHIVSERRTSQNSRVPEHVEQVVQIKMTVRVRSVGIWFFFFHTSRRFTGKSSTQQTCRQCT